MTFFCRCKTKNRSYFQALTISSPSLSGSWCLEHRLHTPRHTLWSPGWASVCPGWRAGGGVAQVLLAHLHRRRRVPLRGRRRRRQVELDALRQPCLLGGHAESGRLSGAGSNLFLHYSPDSPQHAAPRLVLSRVCPPPQLPSQRTVDAPADS